MKQLEIWEIIVEIGLIKAEGLPPSYSALRTVKVLGGTMPEAIEKAEGHVLNCAATSDIKLVIEGVKAVSAKLQIHEVID